MTEKTQEDLVRLAAARSGLKLITNRYSLTSTGRKTYCLRPIWDATRVVGTLSDGRFGLVRTTGRGKRRHTSASWLPLSAIERMLPDWHGARPRSRARVSQWRPAVVATTTPNTIGRAQQSA